jgi:hypothetical protein
VGRGVSHLEGRYGVFVFLHKCSRWISSILIEFASQLGRHIPDISAEPQAPPTSFPMPFHVLETVMRR